MDNPGSFSLGDFNVGAPATQIGTVVDTLAGMASLTVQARFSPTGGATCRAFVQTSFDQGQTWCDLACFAFVTANDVGVINITADTPLTPPALPTDAGLADNTTLSGPIGDRLRAKVVSTGNYTSSTLLSLWAVAR